jgi:hypothetical protein
MKVVMVEFPRTNGSMRRYTQLCESRGIRLLVVADLDQIFGHSVAVFEDHKMFFIGLREEPLEDPVNRFLKRCLDILISLPVWECWAFEMIAASLRGENDIWAGKREHRDAWVPAEVAEKIPEKSEMIYFAGCTASYVETDIAGHVVRRGRHAPPGTSALAWK